LAIGDYFEAGFHNQTN